jgi:uncharacterized protein (TIGR03083 family)
VTWDDYLAAITADSTFLAAAAGRGLDEATPCCPGWTVRDVIGHTGAVHRQKEQIVSEGRLDGQPGMSDPPERDLIPWFEEGAARLVRTLGQSDPGSPIWTWDRADQTVGFWYRRMAQETLIHRVDGEQAHGSVSPINTDLALDGIDEILNLFIGGVEDWGTLEMRPGTIRLSGDGRTWTVRSAAFSGTSPDGHEYRGLPMFVQRDGDGVPDATIEGDAAAVDLWLWGRGPLDDLAVTGDTDLVRLLRETAAEHTR